MNLSDTTSKTIYRFDDVTVDGENFRVRRNGNDISLTPRAFDVLIFLLRNAGRVLEKQEIFEAVWKDTFVSDNALTKVIKEIRHTLEDPADNPHYIQTVPKRGYRFIAEVKNGEDPSRRIQNGGPKTSFIAKKTVLVLLVVGFVAISSLAGWLILRQKSTASLPAPIKSIAVLPFRPLNMNDRDESLEMGMATTLITRLSNLKQVVVRPMSAVRKYTDLHQDPVAAGRELQAEAVLEGNIQKAGERVRITVRLLRTNDGATLWSEQFDENFTDIFNVQDTIADRITTELALELSRQEKEQLAKHYTNSPEAYELYLRAQLLWNSRREGWIAQSLALYQQALEKDPNFAMAHIGVAECYMTMNGHRKIRTGDAEIKAKPSIMKALEIDGTLAQAHNALAEFKYQYEYDWEGADSAFRTAIALNSNIAWIHQAYGWFLMSDGRFDEATLEMERAQELDPSSLTVKVGLGRLYYHSRQYDKAERHFQNLVAVAPHETGLYYALTKVYEQKQMYAEAFEFFLKVRSGMPPKKLEEYRETFRLTGWQGIQRSRVDQIEQHEKREGTGTLDPMTCADIYVRLGDKDKAFEWFEKAFDARDISVIQFKVEPAYDILHDDPRYARLLAKIGLQP